MYNDHIPDDVYKTIIENVPIACVDCTIHNNEGYFLLVKRKDAPAKGQWWLPGGRVLKGEMLKEAAVRKAREEVGLECRVGPIIYTAETIFDDGPFNTAVHSINSVFYMYPTSPNPGLSLDDHHAEYMWVNYIPEDAHSYVQNALRAAGLDFPRGDMSKAPVCTGLSKAHMYLENLHPY